MKVLWLTLNRSNRVANHFDDFRNSFCNIIDTTVLFQNLFGLVPNKLHNQYKNGQRTYKSLLKDIVSEYDVIVCDAMFIWMFEDWKNINIPVYIIIEDQHNNVPKLQIDFAIKHNMGIIHRYKFNKFHTDIPNYIKKIWSPHSVNIKNFKDYGLKKEYGLLQTGTIGGIYTFRTLVNNRLKNKPYYKRIVRPVDETKNQWPIQGEYGKELNKAWLSVCCGAVVEYPVMKFFEIPACKSVLYTKSFKELNDLGFHHGVNMIHAWDDNLHKQVETLLKYTGRLEQIAQNGYDLVHEKHTNEIRAEELKSELERNL